MKQKPRVMENVLRAADTNREFGKCENVIKCSLSGGLLVINMIFSLMSEM